MLDTQNEVDEALGRPIANETTDMTELEIELEELLQQPMPPTPATLPPANKTVVETPIAHETVKPPEQDPFADLELRLQRLGVRDSKCCSARRTRLHSPSSSKTSESC